MPKSRNIDNDFKLFKFIGLNREKKIYQPNK